MRIDEDWIRGNVGEACGLGPCASSTLPTPPRDGILQSRPSWYNSVEVLFTRIRPSWAARSSFAARACQSSRFWIIWMMVTTLDQFLELFPSVEREDGAEFLRLARGGEDALRD
jgi:hypothetical protein